MQGMGTASGHAPGAPRRRGLHPVVWVLICLAGVALLLVLMVAGAGFYIAHQFSEDPVGMATSVIGALDEDLEVVSADRERNTLTVREKSTGKVLTIDLDALKNGSFHIGTGKREVTVVSGGETITIGGSDRPDWLPQYPDADVQRSMTSKGENGLWGSQTFETNDGATRVLDFYESALVKAGLKVTRSSGTALAGRTDDGRREVSVSAAMTGEGSRVILSFTAKD